MMLLLDIGNSRLKWAMAGGDGPGPMYQAWLHTTDGEADFAGLDGVVERPEHVLAGNVAGPKVADACRAWCRERWGLAPRFAVSEPGRAGVRNGYRDHRQLGVDRWLALLAARRRRAGPVCIVDAGTAVTVDLLAADGGHLGGFIVPGVGLMGTALNQSTGNIRRFRHAGPAPGEDATPHVAGRSTAAAVDHGALLAIAGLVDRSLQLLAAGGGKPALLLTGGDAARLLPLVESSAEHCPALVLEGLWVYARSREDG